MKAYSEYKDSGVQWIGEVPMHWEIVPFKFYTNVIMGQSPNGDDIKSEGEMPFMQGNAEFGNTYPSSIYFCETCTKFSRIGDILMSVRAPVGEINLSDKVYGIGRGLCSISAKRCNRQYLWYFLKKSKNDLNIYANGSTFTAITIQVLQSFKLTLPPLPEQQAIASFLDAKTKPIDDIIAKRERQIELLEEMKSAIISRAVTKGLNSDAKMKDSGIEGVDVIPEHWNKTRFVYSSWIRSRLGWRALKADEYKDSGYPFLSAYNIVDNKLVWDDFNYISQERFDESPEIKLNIGDILLVKDGAGLGKCARVDELPEGPSTVNGSLAVITPHEGLSYKYLYYYLLGNTFKQMIDLLRNGMGVPHFTQGNMRTIYLPLPPLGEQEQIVTYLDSTIVKLDVRIAKRRKQIELLQEYKQALITAAVTGKIDVREHIS